VVLGLRRAHSSGRVSREHGAGGASARREAWARGEARGAARTLSEPGVCERDWRASESISLAGRRLRCCVVTAVGAWQGAAEPQGRRKASVNGGPPQEELIFRRRPSATEPSGCPRCAEAYNALSRSRDAPARPRLRRDELQQHSLPLRLPTPMALSTLCTRPQRLPTLGGAEALRDV
jgi:hypothetical protein